MNAPTATPVTAEELLRLSLPDKQIELVRGEVIVREPPAAWHGGISEIITGDRDFARFPGLTVYNPFEV